MRCGSRGRRSCLTTPAATEGGRLEVPSPAPPAAPAGTPPEGLGGAAPRSAPRTAADRRAQPHQRVEPAVHHAFLERDDPVVGEVDALGADLAAALGDVAVAQAEVVLRGA